MNSVARIAVLGAAAASLVFAAPDARAVITVPLPAEPPLAPPPIPALPMVGETTPPAEVIADPVEPAAACGGWYLQTSYGGRWPTSSTWWEFQCTYVYPELTGGGATNADWGGGYVWVDYFYWNGSNAVFYGESFFDGYWDNMITPTGCSYWWDASTSQWYVIECPVEQPSNNAPTASFTFACSGLSCSFDGSGSFDPDGTIYSNDYYWKFGDASEAGGRGNQDHTYAQAGTYTVTLTVTDNGGATSTASREVTVQGTTTPNAAPTASFTYACSGLTCTFNGSASSDTDGTIAAYAWNFGDGSGVGGNIATTEHTYFQPGTYTAGLTVSDNDGAANTQWQVITVKTNAAPTAAFTISCSGLSCALDGTRSADTDGTIVTYVWDLGDGTRGSGQKVSHTYARPGSYTVSLTVTDSAGATGSDSKTINPMSLSARGYKLNGLHKADLSWNGPSGSSFDLYRSGLKIATVQATAYTDNINTKGSGTYTYQVCEAGGTTCSNDATVSF